jgi:predicted flap endonuclease-1-like 5' DNA nuclease
MGFLLVKMLFLLALAAAGGAGFTYWWFRRHYEDISLEYARSREEWLAWRGGFEERLAARPPVDLEPVSAQVAAVHAAVSDIDIPVPERVDLAPVHARLDELARQVGEIRVPDPPDLSSTDERLTGIEHALFPLQTRLDELASAVRALRVPGPQALDLQPVVEQPGEARAHIENPATPDVAVREGSKNLLTHPGHGEPDDLTQIKGVPKVLERKLHKMGVFYFWQIAEWSPDDVRQVDSQLTQFQGCIERDDWVHQASELASLPTAAPRPEPPPH